MYKVATSLTGGRALHTPEEYQLMAARCLHLARVVRDPKEKLILVDMAPGMAKSCQAIEGKS